MMSNASQGRSTRQSLEKSWQGLVPRVTIQQAQNYWQSPISAHPNSEGPFEIEEEEMLASTLAFFIIIAF